MIQFPAYPLVTVLTDLHWLKEYLSSINPQDQDRWPKLSKQFTGIAEVIGEVAQELELIETFGRCQRFNKIITASITELIPLTGIPDKTLTKPEIISEIEGIESSLEKELLGEQFVYIPRSKSKFCEQPALFGETVNQAFPSAATDIKDAGNCLAADLNTAAVFHLMRAVESAMRVLVVHLGIKIKNKAVKEAGWDELIKLIDKKLKERREKYAKSKRKKRSEWSDLKFYGVAADELSVFKENWRDKVMHTWDNYNEHEAMNVFIRVKGFMQKLATKVSETKN
jgi:hypothetical protein